MRCYNPNTIWSRGCWPKYSVLIVLFLLSDKWTGLVTTARVTHATPAAAFAHSASRNWESSAPEGCDDIAAQLISNPLNHEIRVIMGGGRRIFLSNDTFDPEYPTYRMHRVDGRNIIQVTIFAG